MESARIVVCGGGVVGLTLARELLARGEDSVAVLEKEPDVGLHASGRNSGVLHAGIYYAEGSEKARTCLAGNRLMKAYCREQGLPLLENGKVMVTASEAQLPVLHELHRRALAAGADVALVDAHELAEIEPHARTCGQALHSRETAVISPKAVMHSLRAELEAAPGARLLRGCRVLGRGPAHDGRRSVETTLGRIGYEVLVNASGAHADKVAAMFGAGLGYRLLPFKGLYRRLVPERTHLVRGSVYPVPDIRNPFLGVHFTRSVTGEVHIGPTAIPAFGRENYGILKGLDAEAVSILLRDARLFVHNPKFRSVALSEPRKYLFAAFFRDAARLLRDLRPEDIAPSAKVGIRPQLVDVTSNELVMDFVLERSGHELHVLNAISPAFTSSLAFASRLADRVLAML
ncbi:FAD dependent oxidoreductase [Desulfovibrio sp. X2]|uniref:L-2-hydroxyglutarate oxidase n=1 Tax=Desulfovibrio sp. X2 TaxID=941449 RepID=UPI000358E4F8|nr:L-2-hydroxyglutarate oxidase [Desulfovibrio sp. X2]EPR39356.1 FAD dependent oxidoreductase [Desulfovibrio sp. X2]